MKNLLNSKKVYKLILIIFVIYCITIMVKQQIKLNSYATEKKYYQTQIDSLNEEKQNLLKTQESVNSPEYIEKMAREKLEMYLPNETIFIDINK